MEFEDILDFSSFQSQILKIFGEGTILGVNFYVLMGFYGEGRP